MPRDEGLSSAVKPSPTRHTVQSSTANALFLFNLSVFLLFNALVCVRSRLRQQSERAGRDQSMTTSRTMTSSSRSCMVTVAGLLVSVLVAVLLVFVFLAPDARRDPRARASRGQRGNTAASPTTTADRRTQWSQQVSNVKATAGKAIRGAKGEPRAPWQNFRVGRPRESAAWQRDVNGPGPSEVHCLCGAGDLPPEEKACAPILENATGFVDVGKHVTFFVDLSPPGGPANALASWSSAQLAMAGNASWFIPANRVRSVYDRLAKLAASVAPPGRFAAPGAAPQAPRPTHAESTATGDNARPTYADVRLLDLVMRARQCLRTSSIAMPETRFLLRPLPSQAALLGQLLPTDAWPLWAKNGHGGDFEPPRATNPADDARLMGGATPALCPAWSQMPSRRKAASDKADRAPASVFGGVTSVTSNASVFAGANATANATSAAANSSTPAATVPVGVTSPRQSPALSTVEDAVSVLRDPSSTRRMRRRALRVVASEFDVVTSRWGGTNLWHLTWDHGLFQIWLYWRRVLVPWLIWGLPTPGSTTHASVNGKRYHPDTRVAELEALLSVFPVDAAAATQPPTATAPVVNNTASMVNNSASSGATPAPLPPLRPLRLPGPLVDTVHDPHTFQHPGKPRRWETEFLPGSRAAVHEWWWTALEPNDGFVFLEPGRRCRRYHVLTMPKNTVSGRGKIRSDGLSAPMQAHVREFFDTGVLQPLLAKYGDVEPDTAMPIFISNRQPSAEFNKHEERSRGVQYYLRDELVRALWPLLVDNKTLLAKTNRTAVNRRELRRASALPPMDTMALVVGMDTGTPMQHQLHALRRASLVICSEGAFHTLAPLSRPGTTWVVVYNHTRQHDLQHPWGAWKYTNFHAPMSRAFPWVRSVFYMVDNGRRDAIVDPATGDVLPDATIRAFFDGRKGPPFQGGVYFVGADQHGHRVGTDYPA